MIKKWQSHRKYLRFLKHCKTRFDSSARSRWRELRPIRMRLKALNLDPAGEFMQSLYSHTGRPALHQAQILRSFVLWFLLFRKGLAKLSLTDWVNTLKRDELYSNLIGCSSGSSPPLGSYYDFIDRLWAAPLSDWYSRNKTFPSNKNKSKPKKPKGKGEKASEKKSNITRRIADRFLAGKDGHLNHQILLQKFFFLVAVLPSLECGLIPKKKLVLSGDGTALHAHASPYGHSRPSPDPAFRHFSDPDADWGWDSDLEKYYFGYTLYHLSIYNKDIKTDLPLFLRLFNARRHDSVSFLLTYKEFRDASPGISVRDLCLDSAHDNYPTYELLLHDKIRPLIDLNKNRGRPASLPAELKIDTDGTPVCQAGRRMVFWGNCGSRYRTKWRCPVAVGRCDSCPCPCSDSPYGRVIYTKPGWDIRLYTPVPRGTALYRKIYKNRTCTERVNNRILNDYGLHSLVVHSARRYSFILMVIGICIHLDARYKQKHPCLKGS